MSTARVSPNAEVSHSEDSSPKVSTTQRVAQVLTIFAGGDRWLGVSEISRRLDLGKAVVHRILQTLVEEGLLSYSADTRLYCLGPTALSLGRNATRDNDVRAAAMPIISHLAAITGETTTVTAVSGHSRYYVGQVESAQHIRITINVGQRVPMAAGASGLSILAFMPERDIELALRVPLIKYTDRTVVDPDQIRKRLVTIREQGWASSQGERVLHSSSIAAPIFDASGMPAGSLSVAYLESRIVSSATDELSALVCSAAADASAALQAIQRG
jgi:IclR family acetate operon transcriptional repressor